MDVAKLLSGFPHVPPIHQPPTAELAAPAGFQPTWKQPQPFFQPHPPQQDFTIDSWTCLQPKSFLAAKLAKHFAIVRILDYTPAKNCQSYINSLTWLLTLNYFVLCLANNFRRVPPIPAPSFHYRFIAPARAAHHSAAPRPVALTAATPWVDI